MSKYHVAPVGPPWDDLRGELALLTKMVEQPQVDLIELGKAYARLANSVLKVSQAHHLSSLRFEAATKALDLTTPKSELQAFMERE